MTERFYKAPPHSDEALYLLQEYTVKAAPVATSSKNVDSDEIETVMDANMEVSKTKTKNLQRLQPFDRNNSRTF
jgi:hypothetical protein